MAGNTPSLAQFILTESYGKSIIRPSILVLINPHGGQGHAKTIYKNKILPILQAARANVTYFETNIMDTPLRLRVS